MGLSEEANPVVPPPPPRRTVASSEGAASGYWDEAVPGAGVNPSIASGDAATPSMTKGREKVLTELKQSKTDEIIGTTHVQRLKRLFFICACILGILFVLNGLLVVAAVYLTFKDLPHALVVKQAELSGLDRPVANVALDISVPKRWYHNLYNVVFVDPTTIRVMMPDAVDNLDEKFQPLATAQIPRLELGRSGTRAKCPQIPITFNNRIPLNDLIVYALDPSKVKRATIEASFVLQTTSFWIPFRIGHRLEETIEFGEELKPIIETGAVKLAARIAKVPGADKGQISFKPKSVPLNTRNEPSSNDSNVTLERLEIHSASDGSMFKISAQVRYDKSKIPEFVFVRIPEILIGVSFRPVNDEDESSDRSFAQIRIAPHTLRKDSEGDDKGNATIEVRFLDTRREAILDLLSRIRENELDLQFTLSGDLRREATTSHLQAWLSTLRQTINLNEIKEWIRRGEFELPPLVDILHSQHQKALAMMSKRRAAGDSLEDEIFSDDDELGPKPLVSVGIVEIEGNNQHPVIVTKISLSIDLVKEATGFDLSKIAGALPRIRMDTILCLASQMDRDTYNRQMFTFELQHNPTPPGATTFDLYVHTVLVDVTTLIKAMHRFTMVRGLTELSGPTPVEVNSYRALAIHFPGEGLLPAMLRTFEVKLPVGAVRWEEIAFTHGSHRTLQSVLASYGLDLASLNLNPTTSVSSTTTDSETTASDSEAEGGDPDQATVSRVKHQVVMNVETDDHSLTVLTKVKFSPDAPGRAMEAFAEFYWEAMELNISPRMGIAEIDDTNLLRIVLERGSTKISLDTAIFPGGPLKMIYGGNIHASISISDNGSPIDEYPAVIVAWRRTAEQWYRDESYSHIFITGRMGTRNIDFECCLPPRSLLLRNPPNWSSTVTDVIKTRVKLAGLYKQYFQSLFELPNLGSCPPEFRLNYDSRVTFTVNLPSVSANVCVYPTPGEPQKYCILRNGVLPLTIRAELINGRFCDIKTALAKHRDNEGGAAHNFIAAQNPRETNPLADSFEADEMLINLIPLSASLLDFEGLLLIANGLINGKMLKVETSLGYTHVSEYSDTKDPFLARFTNGLGEAVRLTLPGESTLQRPKGPPVPPDALTSNNSLGLEVNIASDDANTILGRVIFRIPKTCLHREPLRIQPPGRREAIPDLAVLLALQWGETVMSATLGESWFRMRITQGQLGIRMDESRIILGRHGQMPTSRVIYLDFHAHAHLPDFSSATVRHYISQLHLLAKRGLNGFSSDMRTTLTRVASRRIHLQLQMWPFEQRDDHTQAGERGGKSSASDNEDEKIDIEGDDDESISSEDVEDDPPGADFHPEMMSEERRARANTHSSHISLKSLVDLWMSAYKRLSDAEKVSSKATEGNEDNPDETDEILGKKKVKLPPPEFSVILNIHPRHGVRHFHLPCFIASMCSKHTIKRRPAPTEFITANVSILDALQTPLEMVGKGIGRLMEKLNLRKYPRFMTLLVRVSEVKFAIAINDMDAVIVRIEPIDLRRLVPLYYRQHEFPRIKEDLFTAVAHVSLPPLVYQVGDLFAAWTFDPTFAPNLDETPEYRRNGVLVPTHYSHLSASVSNARLSRRDRTLLGTLMALAVPETAIPPVPGRLDLDPAAKPKINVIRSNKNRAWLSLSGANVVNPLPFVKIIFDHRIVHKYFNAGQEFMRIVIPRLEIEPGITPIKAIVIMDRTGCGKIKQEGPYIKEFSEILGSIAVGAPASLTARIYLSEKFHLRMDMSFPQRESELATFNAKASGLDPTTVHAVTRLPGKAAKMAASTVSSGLKLGADVLNYAEKFASSRLQDIQSLRSDPNSRDELKQKATEAAKAGVQKAREAAGAVWGSVSDRARHFFPRGYESMDGAAYGQCPVLTQSKTLYPRAVWSDDESEQVPAEQPVQSSTGWIGWGRNVVSSRVGQIGNAFSRWRQPSAVEETPPNIQTLASHTVFTDGTTVLPFGERRGRTINARRRGSVIHNEESVQTPPHSIIEEQQPSTGKETSQPTPMQSPPRQAEHGEDPSRAEVLSDNIEEEARNLYRQQANTVPRRRAKEKRRSAASLGSTNDHLSDGIPKSASPRSEAYVFPEVARAGKTSSHGDEMVSTTKIYAEDSSDLDDAWLSDTAAEDGRVVAVSVLEGDDVSISTPDLSAEAIFEETGLAKQAKAFKQERHNRSKRTEGGDQDSWARPRQVLPETTAIGDNGVYVYTKYPDATEAAANLAIWEAVHVMGKKDFDAYKSRMQAFRDRHPETVHNAEWALAHPDEDFLSDPSEGPEPIKISKKEWKWLTDRHDRHLDGRRTPRGPQLDFFDPTKVSTRKHRRLVKPRDADDRIRQYLAENRESRKKERHALKSTAKKLNGEMKKVLRHGSPGNKSSKPKTTKIESDPVDKRGSSISASDPEVSSYSDEMLAQDSGNEVEGEQQRVEEVTEQKQVYPRGLCSEPSTSLDLEVSVRTKQLFPRSAFEFDDRFDRDNEDESVPRRPPSPPPVSRTTYDGTAPGKMLGAVQGWFNNLVSGQFMVAFNNLFDFKLSILAMNLRLRPLDPRAMLIHDEQFIGFHFDRLAFGEPTLTVQLAPKPCRNVGQPVRQLMLCAEEHSDLAPIVMPPQYQSSKEDARPADVFPESLDSWPQLQDFFALRGGACLAVAPSLVSVTVGKAEKPRSGRRRAKEAVNAANGKPIPPSPADYALVAHVSFIFGNQIQEATPYDDPCLNSLRCIPSNATLLPEETVYQDYYTTKFKVRHEDPRMRTNFLGPLTFRRWQAHPISVNTSLMITFRVRIDTVRTPDPNVVAAPGFSLIFMRGTSEVKEIKEAVNYGYGISRSVALVFDPVKRSVSLHTDGNPNAILIKSMFALPTGLAPGASQFCLVNVRYRPIDNILNIAIADENTPYRPLVTIFKQVNIRRHLGNADTLRVGLGAHSGNYGHFVFDRFLVYGVLPYLPNTKVAYVDQTSVTPFEKAMFLLQLRDSCKQPVGISPGSIKVILKGIRPPSIHGSRKYGRSRRMEPTHRDHSHSSESVESPSTGAIIKCKVVPSIESGVYEVHYMADMPGRYHVMVAFDKVPGKIRGDLNGRIAKRHWYRIPHHKIYVKNIW